MKGMGYTTEEQSLRHLKSKKNSQFWRSYNGFKLPKLGNNGILFKNHLYIYLRVQMMWCTHVFVFSQQEQTEWSFMQFCRTAEVLSHTKWPGTRSRRHYTGQKFLYTFKVGWIPFQHEKMSVWFKYCVWAIYVFVEQRRYLKKQFYSTAWVISSLLTGFNFTLFMLWPLSWSACSMECLYCTNTQVVSQFS